MPFRSEQQRKFMYAKHPEIAKRWSQEAHEEEGDTAHPPENKKSKRKAAIGRRIKKHVNKHS